MSAVRIGIIGGGLMGREVASALGRWFVLENFPVRAELVETATEEIIMAHGADAPTATVFRLRYIEGVTVADRVIFEGVVHDLKGATEIGRRRGLELRTVARP